MGPSARVAAFTSALTLAACAVIAGLDDPQTVSDSTSAEGGASSSSGSLQDTGNGSSSGGGSSSGSSDATSDGASSSGAPADAQPDVPQCPLAKNGDNCTQSSQCCSMKCNEQRKCATDCKSQGTGCDPTNTSSCCVGLYCGNFQCTFCKLAGEQGALDPSGNFRLEHSCCSRKFKPLSTECE